MQGLTKRQAEVLAFIENYIEMHNFSPSYRDIMQHFQFASIASVAKSIAILKRKGVLTGEKSAGRSILPVQKTSSVKSSLEIHLPYIGYIAAREPIEFFPQSQTLAVPEFLVHAPESTYVLRVRGSSLLDEMLADGDVLLVEGRSEGSDGETVLGTTEQHGTLIKKYHPEGSYVRLSSASAYATPLVMRHEDLTIQGIVVALLRIYT